MTVYLNGLMLGLSLIMALGPQNVFLIRQGARRQHAILSAITCFFCDVVLVIASVAGLHHTLEAHPGLQYWIVWFGFIFLMFYGLRAIYCSLAPKNDKALAPAQRTTASRRQIIILSLGFSLLNPHAIIDSLVLIGGGSTQFPGHQRAFLSGVITSSLIWFTVLTLTAYYFSNALTKPRVWRQVEFISGGLMVFLAIKLIS